MEKTERLEALRLRKGFVTKKAFAEALGLSTQALANWYARNTFDENLVLLKFTDVNADWLLTGKGPMLKAGDEKGVPLVPIYAQAGRLTDFLASVRLQDCEMITSPVAGVDFAVAISGDSMEPEYPSGATVLVKKIDETRFIEWGRVYVLDTCNGAVVKRLMPGESQDKLKCVSINDRYPDFEVSLGDVYGIYRVLMVMCRK